MTTSTQEVRAISTHWRRANMFTGIFNRSQASIYRTIGPLVLISDQNIESQVYF